MNLLRLLSPQKNQNYFVTNETEIRKKNANILIRNKKKSSLSYQLQLIALYIS